LNGILCSMYRMLSLIIQELDEFCYHVSTLLVEHTVHVHATCTSPANVKLKV